MSSSGTWTSSSATRRISPTALGYPLEEADENLLELDVGSYERLLGRVLDDQPQIALVASTLRQGAHGDPQRLERRVPDTRRVPGRARVRGPRDPRPRRRRRLVRLRARSTGLLERLDIETALAYGVAHGALAMTTPGDTSMATRAEVERLVARPGSPRRPLAGRSSDDRHVWTYDVSMAELFRSAGVQAHTSRERGASWRPARFASVVVEELAHADHQRQLGEGDVLPDRAGALRGVRLQPHRHPRGAEAARGAWARAGRAGPRHDGPAARRLEPARPRRAPDRPRVRPRHVAARQPDRRCAACSSGRWRGPRRRG